MIVVLSNLLLLGLCFGMSAAAGYDQFGDGDEFLAIIGLVMIPIAALDLLLALVLGIAGIWNKRLRTLSLPMLIAGILMAATAAFLVSKYH